MEIFCFCTIKLADGVQAGVQVDAYGTNGASKLSVYKLGKLTLRREEDCKHQVLTSILPNLVSDFSGRSLQSMSGIQKSL